MSDWLAGGLDIDKKKPLEAGLPKEEDWLASGLEIGEVAPVVEEPVVAPKPEVPVIQEQALAGVTPEGLRRDEGIPVFSEGKMLEDLKRFGIVAGKIGVGAVETVLSLTSGMLLYLPAKLAGVGSLPWGREAMELAEESIASLGYQPYSKAGKAAGEVVAKGFEIFLTPARKAGEMITGLEPGRIAKELLKYPLAGIELSPEQMGYLVEFGVELGEFALTGIMGKRIKNQIRENTRARVERADQMSQVDRLKAEKALAELEAREDISEVTKARKEAVSQEGEFVGPPKPEVVKPEPAEFVSKKTGKPFKTKAASNIRKNQLVEEGIETVAVKVDEGWVLKRREVVEEPKLVKRFVEVPDKSLVDEAIPEGEPRVVEGKVEPRVEPGTRDPLNSAFFEDLETTQVHKKLYNDPERANSVKGDPDLTTMKYVNDVNRWYHGENLDITQIRTNLSELASSSPELVRLFEKRADFESFKSFISDAASWARKMKREGEGPSLDLRSGIDPGEAFKLITKMYEKLEEASKKALKVTMKERIRRAKRKGLDVSANIKVDMERYAGDEGVRIGEQKDLERGANARSANVMHQAEKEVFKGLSSSGNRELNRVARSLRIIEIDRIHGEGVKKHPDGYGGDYHKAYLAKLAEANPRLFNDLLDRANKAFDILRNEFKHLYDAELITEELYNTLKDFDYTRTQLVDLIDPEIGYGKKGLRVRDSGVKPLKVGKETDLLETDLKTVMLETITRTENRVMKQRANKLLLNFARSDPENPFARLKTKEAKIPRGWKKFEVFEKGEKVDLRLSPEFAKEWIASDAEMSQNWANLIRIISGSAILRPMATGINPAFALRQLPKDIMHIWLTSQTFIDGKWESTYSPHFVRFVGEMGLDLAEVFSDVMTRKGEWLDYVEEGGGMEFLSGAQGKPLRKRLGKETEVDKVMDILGYLNISSEMLTRTALRRRSIKKQAKAEGITFEEALKNKGITTRATAVARGYIDFNQGGGYAKAIDTGWPYFNAQVQGSRGIWRSASRDIKTFAYKIGQLAMITVGLHLANRYVNREAYDSVGEEVRKRNFVFTTPFSYRDELNQLRHVIFTIPKDPDQMFFSTFFEYVTDWELGLKPDVDALVDTLTDLLPVKEITSILPSLQGALKYMTNRDAYLGRDLWRGDPDVRPSGQFKPGKTHPFFIDVGKVSAAGRDKPGPGEISPDKMRGFLETIFTRGNLYSEIVGWGYKELFDDLPKSERDQHWAEILSKFSITKPFIKTTSPYTKYKRVMKEAEGVVATKRELNLGHVDRLIDGYLFHKNVKIDEIREAIRDAGKADGKDEADRLFDRFVFQRKVKDLNNRIFWLRLQKLVPEARAMVFNEVWDKASLARKDDMRFEMSILSGRYKTNKKKGIFSDQFFRELAKIQSEERESNSGK